MSRVVKRSVILGGHKTSVTLADEFWDALRAIAHRDKTTVASLVGQINQTQNKSNLSSAIRIFVLKRSALGGPGEAKADRFDEPYRISGPFSPRRPQNRRSVDFWEHPI